MARHGPPAPPRALDESMTLLNELQRRPLDPGYAEAALQKARRADGGRRGPFARAAALVMAGVLGVSVTAAALTLRQPTPGDRQARLLLEDQVRERKDVVERLEAANAETGAQIAALQASALSSQDPALLESTRRWSIASGAVPVTGPGLRIVLSDAAAAAETDKLDLRVQDVDLQVLVNGLWAAGAEAVAVNRQRVGPTTAIRSAGNAILVDLVPLVGPYTVEAIGDAGGLQAELARSSAGQHVAMLHATYGIGVEMTSAPKLELGGSGGVVLRAASVPQDALLAAGLADAAPAAVVPGSGPDDEGGIVP